jgi:hypothetical protein
MILASLSIAREARTAEVLKPIDDPAISDEEKMFSTISELVEENKLNDIAKLEENKLNDISKLEKDAKPAVPSFF